LPATQDSQPKGGVSQSIPPEKLGKKTRGIKGEPQMGPKPIPPEGLKRAQLRKNMGKLKEKIGPYRMGNSLTLYYHSPMLRQKIGKTE